MSAAEAAFAALTDDQRARLLGGVFEILEYDEDGEPGQEWSSDTTQDLGELFGHFGIVFTSPEQLLSPSPGPLDGVVTGDEAPARPETITLAWTGDGLDGRQAPSLIRYRIAGMTSHYTARPTGTGRWVTTLVVCDCGQEVPEVALAFGDFDTEDAAMAAAQRYETNHTQPGS